jgi:hypothetical protein
MVRLLMREMSYRVDGKSSTEQQECVCDEWDC